MKFMVPDGRIQSTLMTHHLVKILLYPIVNLPLSRVLFLLIPSDMSKELKALIQ